MAEYEMIKAKNISYGGIRNLYNIEYIVIHYTGNDGDTARNNCNFFARGNTRSAGAHFFVSRDGEVLQSIPIERTAYAVGGFVTQANGAGSFYKKCLNSNSVSIELCDNASKDPSEEQIKAVRKLIAYIIKHCPNATNAIRHWDVSGKSCPARMIGVNNAKWNAYKTAILQTNFSPGLETDGVVGFQTTKVWQQIMGTSVDGVISGQSNNLKKYHLAFKKIHYGVGGSSLIRAVQKSCGVSQDGQLGPNTIKAIQSRLGCVEDGYFGVMTAKALQARLNSGRF